MSGVDRRERAAHPRFEVGAMAPEEEPRVRALLRAPMDGTISLSLEREPDSERAAAVQGERRTTVVVRDRERGGRVIATGSRSARPAYWRGGVHYLGYLGELRRDPAAPPAPRRILREAFAALERCRQPDELPFDVTSIMADNAPARRLLERGLPGLPRYQPAAELFTYAVPAGGRGRPLGAAEAGDLADVAACLQRNLRARPFAPRWTEGDLRDPARCRDLHPGDFALIRDGGRVRACAALWDQRAFKQAVVRGYRGWLRGLRPVLNAGCAIAKRPRLPAPGSPLAIAYLSHVAVEGDDPAAFLDLVGALRRRAAERGLGWLVAAFSRGHPLGRALERRFSPRTATSILYTVDSHSGGAPDLGPRAPHVEVATL